MSDKATLLVVDDTPANLDILVNLFNAQYRVKVANSGENALKVMKAKPYPDLILLDIMMPDMDGFEVCKRLKDNPETAKIPIIFVTAMSEIADEEKGLVLGAVDYITKPVSPPIVMARVDTHLKLANQRMALESEVRERTLELHKQNKRLSDELHTRKLLEEQIRFQFAVQKGAADMARLQLKSSALEECYQAIVKTFSEALSLDGVALYSKGSEGWTLIDSLPADIAPKLNDEDILAKAQSDEGEHVAMLSDGDEDRPVAIWLYGSHASGAEVITARQLLLDEARVLLQSAQVRDSIASMNFS